jgi:ATP-binding cassette subfamily B protein
VYAAATALALRFLRPLATFGQVVDEYQRAMAAVSRVLDLLELPTETVGGRRRLTTTRIGDVELDNVSFAYPDRPAVLNRLSLHFRPGTVSGLVGTTGAGKTTIIKLLLRFYDAQSGQIRLDGIDIRQISLVDVRQAIGLVSQDVFLFDGTIRENLAYGTFDADMASIVEAARLAEADDFIERLPGKYETVVGDRGVRLSTGQRQRICLARAIVKNPSVLILDEATSAVDNETEAAIQRALEQVSKGRTTIVIAHRLSTVRNADQIYVLGQDGSVAERGRHEQLIARGGQYAALWCLQTGDRSD